ncbi:acyl-CoA thioesterase [Thalassorhabdomicrobium marinisediminis]|uniref:acyl-CoA thioesterase n=1 Tax=Thalassorhabdomicrobium marinisediminis TaxID=2170577 RepID=UPI0024916A91|nr:thioesterase family protein [Thalassorhabdomicrobium marinisediminis]
MTQTDLRAGRDYSVSFRGSVLDSWIDVNGHMNVAWYDHVFDTAESLFFEEFAIDDAYIRRTGFSFFRIERLVRYAHEVLPADPIEVRSRVLWSNLQRVHHVHELWVPGRSERCAISDAVSIHVDLSTRRPVAIDLPEVVDPLRNLLAAHTAAPPPPRLPKRINGHLVNG